MHNEPELLDADEACRLLGGSRPINRATLYRGVADGRYPKPIKIGAASSRWLRSELIAAIAAMAAARTAKVPA